MQVLMPYMRFIRKVCAVIPGPRAGLGARQRPNTDGGGGGGGAQHPRRVRVGIVALVRGTGLDSSAMALLLSTKCYTLSTVPPT